MSDPTPYPTVNNLLRILIREHKAILTDGLVAFYLHGSLALGDFDIEDSDIDYLIVTRDEISAKAWEQLAAVKRRFQGSGIPLAMRLDGLFATEVSVRCYQPDRLPLQNGPIVHSQELDAWGSQSVLDRYVVRNQGVVVSGPPPASLIDPISPADLRQAVRATVNESWASHLDENRIWFFNPAFAHNAVITLCRVLYTLEHGDMVSKPTAITWARETLDARWDLLIRQVIQSNAGDWQSDEPIAFLRYVVERCQS